jgi:glycerol uptake facilitator protein
VYLYFKQHYNKTDDLDLQFATFSTSPAIRNFRSNLFSEIVGTFVLLLLVFFIAGPSFEGDTIGKVAIGLGSIGAIPVTLVVLGIGISLGGTTGYAINPARDLGPRIAYTILPFHKKGSSDWSYSWIPVVGPIIGAVIAAALFLFSNTL